MDESEIIASVLNNSISRHTKSIQSYEIEIANLMAEVLRLQKRVEDLSRSEEKNIG